MSLSIHRLKELLESKNFFIKRTYSESGLYMYIHLTDTNGNDMLLYIPSKYDIPVDKSLPNDFKIKEFEIDNINNDNIAIKYADDNKINDINNNYIDLDMENKLNNKELEEQLEKNYESDIIFYNIEEKNTVKDCTRQLKRLGLSVKNIKYKLGILYSTHLIIIRRDDTISCFNIKNFIPENKLINILVISDLEIFYEKLNVFQGEVIHIQDSIQNLLDRNNNLHLNRLHTFIQNKNNNLEILTTIQTKKNKNLLTINEYRKIYADLENIETNLTDAKSKIFSSPNEQFNHLSSIDNELTNIYIYKQKLSESIKNLLLKVKHLSLSIDKLLFDNQIMIDKIDKNLNMLHSLSLTL